MQSGRVSKRRVCYQGVYPVKFFQLCILISIFPYFPWLFVQRFTEKMVMVISSRNILEGHPKFPSAFRRMFGRVAINSPGLDTHQTSRPASPLPAPKVFVSWEKCSRVDPISGHKKMYRLVYCCLNSWKKIFEVNEMYVINVENVVILLPEISRIGLSVFIEGQKKPQQMPRAFAGARRRPA